MRAMSRHPEHRFATASDLRVALLACRTVGSDGPVTAAVPVDPDVTEVAVRPDSVGSNGAPTGTAPAQVAGTPVPMPTPRRRRRWGAPAVAVLLIVTALIVAGVLLTRDATNPSLPDATTTSPDGAPASPIPVQAVATFDPFGDNKTENPGDLPKAVDANPRTAWSTEWYFNRKFSSSQTKTGVGLIVTTPEKAKLGTLTVASPTQDWTAQVYVSDRQGATLADWGSPVAEQSGIKGTASFDLGAIEGQFILVWITDLGTGPASGGSPPVVAFVDEITLNAPA
jgi:hypothetical protein